MSTVVIAASPQLEAAWARGILLSAQSVVAVDGGAEICRRFGVVPEVVVGDLDSVSSNTCAWLEETGVLIQAHPTNKNYSDLDASLEWLRSQGRIEPIVIGILGGRIDHEIAALGSLARAADLAPTMISPSQKAYVLSANARTTLTEVESGAVFSVQALVSPAIVSILRARYSVERLPLEPLSSLGMSNVSLAEKACVTVHSGTTLVSVNC